jgi:hypothetical protein
MRTSNVTGKTTCSVIKRRQARDALEAGVEAQTIKSSRDVRVASAIHKQSLRSTRRRCTNHKTENMVDKLPLEELPTWVPRLRATRYEHCGKPTRLAVAAVVHCLGEATVTGRQITRRLINSRRHAPSIAQRGGSCGET